MAMTTVLHNLSTVPMFEDHDALHILNGESVLQHDVSEDTESGAGVNIHVLARVSVEGVVGTVVGFFIVLTNAVLLGIVLKVNNVWKSRYPVLIINTAVVDIIIASVVLPFTIYQRFRSVWELGPVACHYWAYAQMVVVPAIFFSLLVLVCDGIHLTLSPHHYFTHLGHAGLLILIVLPWTIAISVVSVFYVKGLEITTRVYNVEEFCAIAWISTDWSMLYFISTYYIPAGLTVTITLLLVFLLFWNCTHMQQSVSEADNVTNEQKIRTMRLTSSVCLVTFSSILLWLPFYAINTWDMYCVDNGCISNRILNAYLLWLGYASSGIKPLLWLTYKDLRDRFTYCIITPSRRDHQSTENGKMARIKSMHTDPGMQGQTDEHKSQTSPPPLSPPSYDESEHAVQSKHSQAEILLTSAV